MKLRSEDRAAFGAATVVFALLAMMFSFAAMIVAGQAWSRSNDAKAAVAKLAAGGVLSSTATVRLQEFSMTPQPAEIKAGTVRIQAHNVGGITHEMVLVRAPDAAALPKVTTPGDRALGDVNEEAIPESDKVGETGDVKAGKTVTKSFKLSPGTYVMFCNIDNKVTDGTVLSHFQHGMSATITVK